MKHDFQNIVIIVKAQRYIHFGSFVHIIIRLEKWVTEPYRLASTYCFINKCFDVTFVSTAV